MSHAMRVYPKLQRRNRVALAGAIGGALVALCPATPHWAALLAALVVGVSCFAGGRLMKQSFRLGQLLDREIHGLIERRVKAAIFAAYEAGRHGGLVVVPHFFPELRVPAMERVRQREGVH